MRTIQGQITNFLARYALRPLQKFSLGDWPLVIGNAGQNKHKGWTFLKLSNIFLAINQLCHYHAG